MSNTNTGKVRVGGYVLASEDIELNAGRPVTTIKVRNTGDRPSPDDGWGHRTQFADVWRSAKG